MLSRQKFFVVALTAAVSVSLIASACSQEKKTPEEQITAQLDEAMAALEAAKLGDAAELLAEDYKDGVGRDKRKMKAIAYMVMRQGRVSIKRMGETIQVDGDKATVTTKVWAVQTNADAKVVGDLIPRGQAREVVIQLERRDDEWQVTSIDGDALRGD